MTPEEIAARLEKIETTLEEHAEELQQASLDHARLMTLRATVRELAEAIKLLPDGYAMQMAGGKDQAAGKIRNIADKVLRDLE